MPRLDPYQRVAAADLVGAAGDHVDVHVVRRRRRREDAQQHEPGHDRSHALPPPESGCETSHTTAHPGFADHGEQMRPNTNFRPRSMRARLLIQILPVVALAIAALTAVAVTAASSAQRDAVYGEMSELIGREANRFDARARADMAAAQDLAAALEADPSISREHGRDVVRRFAERRPELLGTWAAFEPNAFDGRDADYAGAEPLGDPKGRFAVWAQRIDGPLKIEAFEDQPGNPWADDDYYVKPLEAAGDVVLDPYFDSGAMMTSYTTAIKRDGARRRRDRHRRRARRAGQADQGRRGARQRLRVRRRADRHARRLPRPQAGWTGKKTAKDIGVPAEADPGPRGLGRDQGPRRRPRRRHVPRAGEDRRLELRGRRAEGRDPRRRRRAAHEADPRRPAGAAAGRRRARVRRRPPEPPGARGGRGRREDRRGRPRRHRAGPHAGRGRPHGRRLRPDGRVAARDRRAPPRRSPAATSRAT